jgi:hypothetical protein
MIREYIPWPSPRAQWSAFFALFTLLLNVDTVHSQTSLVARFLTIFLIFYFPVAWVWNYEFEFLSSTPDEG